jgi:hypothetical protein
LFERYGCRRLRECIAKLVVPQLVVDEMRLDVAKENTASSGDDLRGNVSTKV